MKKLKIGIAGARGLSTVLGLNSLPDVEITALCDLDENVLKYSGDNLNIAPSTATASSTI